MSGWKSKVLARIQELARQGRVILTRKAAQELEDLDIGMLPSGVREVVLSLGMKDAVERLRSHQSDEWLYLFNPQVDGVSVYLKVAVHEDCVVISFHEYL